MFYSYFDYLCKKKGVSKNKACQDMGLSRSVASKWKSTDTQPSMDTLKRIAAYFNVSIDVLLAHSNNETTILDASEVSFDAIHSEDKKIPDLLTKAGIDEKTLQLFDLFNVLNEDQKDTVIAQLQGLVQHQSTQDFH